MMRRHILLVMLCLFIPVVAEAANTTYYVESLSGVIVIPGRARQQASAAHSAP